MIFATIGLADPVLNKTVSFSESTAPAIQVYQANTRTIRWAVLNNNIAANGNGYTPFMWIAPYNKSPNIVTAVCTWVSQVGGTFDAVFSPSDLNTNGMNWVYGVGYTSTSPSNTTARQGLFSIVADPYAGASPITYTTPMNMALYTYSNTTNGSLIAGSNVTTRSVGSRGQQAIDATVTIANETDPITLPA